MRVNASSPLMSILVNGSMISNTSPPEQKLSPAPITTTTFTWRSYTSARNTSRSSA